MLARMLVAVSVICSPGQRKDRRPNVGLDLVLFLPCLQNHARKSLCNLRTLKPHRADFMQQQLFLTIFMRGTVYV